MLVKSISSGMSFLMLFLEGHSFLYPHSYSEMTLVIVGFSLFLFLISLSSCLPLCVLYLAFSFPNQRLTFSEVIGKFSEIVFRNVIGGKNTSLGVK